jgi:hypothetical protein
MGRQDFGEPGSEIPETGQPLVLLYRAKPFVVGATVISPDDLLILSHVLKLTDDFGLLNFDEGEDSQILLQDFGDDSVFEIQLRSYLIFFIGPNQIPMRKCGRFLLDERLDMSDHIENRFSGLIK